MLLRHSGDSVMKFICNACVKTFARADTLARHLETAQHLENTKRQGYYHQPSMSTSSSPAIRQARLKKLERMKQLGGGFTLEDERKTGVATAKRYYQGSSQVGYGIGKNVKLNTGDDDDTTGDSSNNTTADESDDVGTTGDSSNNTTSDESDDVDTTGDSSNNTTADESDDVDTTGDSSNNTTADESDEDSKTTDGEADGEDSGANSDEVYNEDGREEANFINEKDDLIMESLGEVMYACCQRQERRQKLLENADPKLFKCICQCAKLILNGTVPINYMEKDNLAKYRKTLRLLADNDVSAAKKKDVIIQSGGNFLLSLIPTVVGALAAMSQ